LLTTHKDPDVDGIGSMLALGQALEGAGKRAVVLTERSIPARFARLRGAERIVQELDEQDRFDAVVILDCGDLRRLGESRQWLPRGKRLINIDHHETNEYFGDLNLADPGASSTAELVLAIVKKAGLPMNYDVAENVFAAIQADTGSFRYENTTSACFRAAGEMLEYGVSPWHISRNIMDGYRLSRLRLLEMALGTLEFYYQDSLGLMSISRRMLEEAGAGWSDTERLVDYPRFVFGVEVAALIREKRESIYKFSLRSNGRVNVADLASHFNGGGHARAAGFEGRGYLESLKGKFLDEAGRFLADPQ